MTDLQLFLLSNPVDNLTKKVIVSERLKNNPFTIKCATSKELDEYQKRCIKNPLDKKKMQFDTATFNELIVLNHCVEPNFRDAEWLKQAGCETNPRALLYKVLTAGEIANTAAEIQKLSGFGEIEQEEMVEEAKNF